MNVLDQLPRIGVFLDQMGLEATLVQMPATAVAAIETDAVSRLEPTGRVAQIGARCLGQQVKVIRHQAIRMDYEPETLNGFFKRLQKPLPIAIIAINWLTFVAAGRDMIHGAFKLYSDRACHNARYDTATRCQVSRVDPYSRRARFG